MDISEVRRVYLKRELIIFMHIMVNSGTLFLCLFFHLFFLHEKGTGQCKTKISKTKSGLLPDPVKRTVGEI